jgi:hypothetical protein
MGGGGHFGGPGKDEETISYLGQVLVVTLKKEKAEEGEGFFEMHKYYC